MFHKEPYLVVVMHLHHVPLAVADPADDVRRNCGFGLAWKRVREMNSRHTFRTKADTKKERKTNLVPAENVS